MLLCLPLLSQQLQLCAYPPRFRVFGVSFHPPGFLLRLLSCAPSTLYSTWVFFFFLVSFLWFWVFLSSFLLLSPLLEPSLLFFFVVCQVPAGGHSCNTTQKKKKVLQRPPDSMVFVYDDGLPRLGFLTLKVHPAIFADQENVFAAWNVHSRRWMI